MKKTLKILGIVLLILVVFVVGLKLYFNDQRLQSLAMPYINDAVGREVQVDRMSLTLFSTFPHVGIDVQGLMVPGEQPNDTLFAMDEMVAGVELIPLLSKKINITELNIRHPQFIYKVNKEGASNIDFLLNKSEEPAPAESGQTSIDIPLLTISNAVFGYQNAVDTTDIMLRGVDANITLKYAELIQSAVQIDVKGLSASMGGTQFLNDLPLHFTQESTIDMDNEQLTLNKGTFSIRGLALNLDGSISKWSSDAPEMDLNFTSSSDDFKQLLRLAPAEYSKQINELDSRGALALDGHIQGALKDSELPKYDITFKVSDGYLKNPDLPQPVQDIQIDAHATNNQITINTLQAKSGTNSLSASGVLNQPMDEEKRNIDLKTNFDLDLASIKDFYPISEDTLALKGKLTAAMTLKGAAKNIQKSVQSGHITLKNGYINYNKFGQPITDLQVESRMQGNKLNISNASMKSGKNTLAASGSITNYMSDHPDVNIQTKGSAQLDEVANYFSLKPYVNKLTGNAQFDLNVRGPANEPSKMALNGNLSLKNVNAEGDSLPQPVKNLNAELNATPQAMNLKNLTMQLGSSDMDISGSLQHYMAFLQVNPSDSDPVPTLKGSYHSKLLNIDDWIDWDEESTDQEYPIDLPRLKSSVQATIDKLVITGVTLTDLKATGGLTPNQVSLENAEATLFDGKATGSFEWNVPQPTKTNIHFKGQLDNVRAESFFKEFHVLGKKSEFYKYISGGFSADVNYKTGMDVYLNPDINSTVSNGNFGMTKVRLKQHPVQEKLAALLKTPELNNLAMDQWKADYNISDGILTMKNLKLTSGNIGAELDGSQNLTSGSLNYQFKVYLPGSFKGKIASIITKDAADALTQKNGTILLPLHLDGTVNKPTLKPDKETITPIVKDYLKNKAGKALKGIFDKFN